MNDNGKDIIYNYKFKFPNNKQVNFDVRLDYDTLSLKQDPKESYPGWIDLKFNKCQNCTLDINDHKYCPVAINVNEIIETFKDCYSTDNITLRITNETRIYEKETFLEDGVSSLIGIYMVTSGCPILDKLRPMVRYHLPFATLEETKYRAISMYLLAQYMIYKSGKAPDWDLKNLAKIYNDIRVVNKDFSKRLLNINIKDSSINALVKLDCFAGYVSFSLIDENMMSEMKELFSSYLK